MLQCILLGRNIQGNRGKFLEALFYLLNVLEDISHHILSNWVNIGILSATLPFIFHDRTEIGLVIVMGSALIGIEPQGT